MPVAGRPIRDAAVTVDRGTIVAVGALSAADAVDLGRVALLPGLVNAHTHLELSYLRGTIPRADRFTDWVRPVLQARRTLADPNAPEVIRAAATAIDEAKAYGTVAVGDVTSTLVTGPLLAEAEVRAVLFHELLGFDVADPEAVVARARDAIEAQPVLPGVRYSQAPHAPYSVSPGLFNALRDDLDRRSFPRSTVHLGESPEEVELLRSGSGPWRTLLGELGVWTDRWQVSGAAPVAYLEELGFSHVLVVHGVQFGSEDLSRLCALNGTIVSCPRSNEYVGVGAPPLEAFYASGVQVALGTDSLASNEDLNLFAELQAARRVAPRVPATALLESATIVGARALGLDEEIGSIEPGKRAALIAVQVPAGVVDVEEYLVTGVTPDAIAWVPVDSD